VEGLKSAHHHRLGERDGFPHSAFSVRLGNLEVQDVCEGFGTPEWVSRAAGPFEAGNLGIEVPNGRFNRGSRVAQPVVIPFQSGQQLTLT
jgi:hypothetical protein